MMERFPLPLNVQLLQGGYTGRLLAKFLYWDVDYAEVVVPVGFETDFASVRPLRNIAVGLLVLGLVIGWFMAPLGALVGMASYGVLALYAGVVGYGHAAATIHDRLYATGELSRKASDRVFYNALRSSGVARWRAWLMYAGVRLGGHWRYRSR
ncbi:DUF1353 domain-containing protein [Stutzerimonas stutzeri]|uniref:DUF1353 domain-containing protein n=1 Tax=Stutzerimonas stutzeri TaxID=316 RepID=UPI0021099BE5|nr:DUF1353 domain-containing protein [Stutzerimonas stutzeri]MCQ4242012.1 DUF1353 domain-containing protein [Stutzerimonas stutzeri]